MTGSLISFEEADQLGLLNELVEKDQVVEKTFEWLGELVQLPPNAMNLTRLTANQNSMIGLIMSLVNLQHHLLMAGSQMKFSPE
ncbi:MAG: hypothetical protein Ct9H300mP6_05270 [Gammaproteobacteria bacterium]|nr:MAG: hypothetical protein Ct9H300mP6_05270 [Gammaproteobacteria bacterium]